VVERLVRLKNALAAGRKARRKTKKPVACGDPRLHPEAGAPKVFGEIDGRGEPFGQAEGGGHEGSGTESEKGPLGPKLDAVGPNGGDTLSDRSIVSGNHRPRGRKK